MQISLNACCIGGPCVEHPALDLAQVLVLAALSLAGAVIVVASTAFALM